MNEKGQTLIEVLITILLISMSVIALVRFQRYLAYNNMLTQQKTDAIILAESKIETLRDFQVYNNTTGYVSYQSITTGSSTSTGENTTYTLNWTVTSYTDPTYKKIDVTVSWTDQNGASQSIQLITNIAGIEPAYSSVIM